jgi:hypothetical protein
MSVVPAFLSEEQDCPSYRLLLEKIGIANVEMRLLLSQTKVPTFEDVGLVVGRLENIHRRAASQVVPRSRRVDCNEL